MIDIKDEDIRYAEGIFLKDGQSFGYERISVIKCMESKDIQACPGSGKTTTLLAKLAIIAKKMPLKYNKGICVLTHTNVAINEIKYKLGPNGTKLFEYPNFFGTIQSFVDKFFAIPACVELVSNKPYIIDDEVYNNVIYKKYIHLNCGTKGWVDRQHNPEQFIQSIRFSSSDIDSLENVGNLRDRTKPTYKNLYKMKIDILKDGILCFDDAYSLSFWYLRNHSKALKSIFSERFAFVFIDEMQDTDSHQNEIINGIFDKSKVVVQKFGDVNQSIFDSSVKTETVWDVNDDCLNINGSKRFSNRIADIVKPFCVHEQNVSGNSSIEEIQPIVLQFDNDTIESVLPTFAQIINKHNLSDKINKFKAVGWVGVNKENEITLISYFSNFQKKSQLEKSNFNYLSEYLQKRDVENVNHYRKMILNALLKVLRLLDEKNKSNSRYFTERSLIRYLNISDSTFYDDLNHKMADWCSKIHNGGNILDELIDFIKNDFCPFFKITNLENIVDFLNNYSTTTPKEQTELQNTNIYNHESGIDIEIATIHSVKGETHTATLYLETFYYEYDVKQIIATLRKNADRARDVQRLKMAYVGMTRPTHLLCVAAHKNSINGNEEILKSKGWCIMKVSNGTYPEDITPICQSTLFAFN
jgi:superfamily I DNA/RNA helicase